MAPPDTSTDLPLRASVRDALRDLIVGGELPPGARLVERTLADRLGVSRVPVREALRDLEAEGFAITRRTRGIEVRRYPAAEVEELLEIRGALESILLRRAAGGVSPAGAARLRESLARTGAALASGDHAAAVAGNARFHEELSDVAAGPVLRGLLAGLRDRMRWLLRQHGDPAAIHAEHVALLDAVLARDVDAVERLGVQHLSTSRAAWQRLSLLVATLALLLAGCAGPTSTEDPVVSSVVASSFVSSSVSSASPSSSAMPESTSAATPESTSAAVPESVPVRDPALDGPLRDAAWADDVARAAELIAAGADVNAKDDTQQSAYLIATSEGYPELLELTMAHGADLSSLDSYQGTGLIRAAERGHADIVGRLLRAGIAVNHVNRPGWTALDEAIVYGDGSPSYVDTVRALVAGGADLDRVASNGRTPVGNAQEQGQTAVIATLTAAARAPADPAAALLAAAADGDADAVTAALRAGAPIESRDPQGRTPLLLAASNDQIDVARLLVVLGADPDAQDDRRDSAWLVTGVTGSVAMLETLLPADPDLALTNRFGGVSVIPASERGHVDYVRRVVQTGIDVNHVNDPGWTALLEAIVYGDGSAPYQEIVDILLAAGADPTIADAQGVTPLQHARERGQDEIADRLAAAGG